MLFSFTLDAYITLTLTAFSWAPPSLPQFRVGVFGNHEASPKPPRPPNPLGGSWCLETSYNGTYNPLLSPRSALIWL